MGKSIVRTLADLVPYLGTFTGWTLNCYLTIRDAEKEDKQRIDAALAAAAEQAEQEEAEAEEEIEQEELEEDGEPLEYPGWQSPYDHNDQAEEEDGLLSPIPEEEEPLTV